MPTPHRVINADPHKSRISCAFFYEPVRILRPAAAYCSSIAPFMHDRHHLCYESLTNCKDCRVNLSSQLLWGAVQAFQATVRPAESLMRPEDHPE